MFISGHKLDARDRISAKLDADREALERSISALGDRLSVPSLAKEALSALKGESLPYLKALGGAARANPLPFALMGAALAWMAFGRKGRRSSLPVLREALSRWEDEGGNIPSVSIKDDSWIAEIDRLRLISMRELNGIDASVLNQTVSSKAANAARERILADLAEDVRSSLREGLGNLPKSKREQIATARETYYLTRITQA